LKSVWEMCSPKIMIIFKQWFRTLVLQLFSILFREILQAQNLY